MKRTRVLLLVIGVGIVGSGAGFWFGLHRGADFGLALASAWNGSSSVMYLDAIQRSKIDDYTVVMESHVDQALLANHYLEGRSVFRFLPLVWGSDADASLRKALVEVANYRKVHPSPQRPEALEALRAQIPESERANLPEITPSMRESMAQTQRIIAEMVARYADKRPQTQ